jgi:hypothetical protein
MRADSFEFWRRYLLVVSALFAVQGASWVLMGSFDPFGFYTGLLARSFWGTARLTPEAQKVFSFTVGPLGATVAGYFLMVHMLARFALPRREAWAYWTIVGALLLWFILDSAASLFHGMLANVLIVNIPCLIIMGLPLLALRRAFPLKRTLPHTHSYSNEPQ